MLIPISYGNFFPANITPWSRLYEWFSVVSKLGDNQFGIMNDDDDDEHFHWKIYFIFFLFNAIRNKLFHLYSYL